MKLGFIGAGNMASALARGSASPPSWRTSTPARRRRWPQRSAARPWARAPSWPRRPTRSCSATSRSSSRRWRPRRPSTRGVVSILAATSTSALASAYPSAAIYRFIPNMPVEVRRGVLCYVGGPGAAEGPEDEILELMGRTGTVIRLDDEPLIEPAMALMSCGPAFMALVAESFADAGAAHGLEPDAAMRMVVETMGGTADWLAAHGYDGPDLRARGGNPRWDHRAGADEARGRGAARAGALRGGRGRGRPANDRFPAARRHARRRGRLRAHAGPRLSRADLHPDHHEAGSRGCHTTAT